jgi:hypothetical protein
MQMWQRRCDDGSEPVAEPVRGEAAKEVVLFSQSVREYIVYMDTDEVYLRSTPLRWAGAIM